MTWKVDKLWWKFFWSFLQTIATTENCFYFIEIHVHVLDQFEKKNSWKFEKNSKNVQFLKFHLWLCGRNFGRSAENSIKNILLPKIITKKILSKIRPLHHQNIQKVDPPRNGHLGGGGGSTLYVTFPSNVLNCQSFTQKWPRLFWTRAMYFLCLNFFGSIFFFAFFRARSKF